MQEPRSGNSVQDDDRSQRQGPQPTSAGHWHKGSPLSPTASNSEVQWSVQHRPKPFNPKASRATGKVGMKMQVIVDGMNRYSSGQELAAPHLQAPSDGTYLKKLRLVGRARPLACHEWTIPTIGHPPTTPNAGRHTPCNHTRITDQVIE